MGIQSNQHKQKEDQNDLRRAFFQSYDRSLITQKIKQLLNDDTKLQFIGGGRHFEAYLLKIGEYAFSVNIADEDFSKNATTGKSSWKKLMERLAANQLNLVPPFDTMTIEERVALVLPYGEGNALELKAHWTPLLPLIRSFEEEVNNLGFAIQDSIQIRSRQGVPFIHDFSDLAVIRDPSLWSP